MKILPRRMNAMLAVVPAVLGRPDAVFGQFSVNTNYQTKINKLMKFELKAFINISVIILQLLLIIIKIIN